MISIRRRSCVWTCAIIWVWCEYSAKVGKIFMYIYIIRAIPAKCQPDFTIWTTIKSSLQLVPKLLNKRKLTLMDTWLEKLPRKLVYVYHCSWQRKSGIICATWRKEIYFEGKKINLWQLFSKYILTNHLTKKLCHKKSLLQETHLFRLS
jgi:hypothetical protein